MVLGMVLTPPTPPPNCTRTQGAAKKGDVNTAQTVLSQLKVRSP